MEINCSTIVIHASRKKVWDILTRPEQVKRWQYGSDLVTSWEPGSDIKFSTSWEGQIFEQWGKVLEVKYPGSLKYSLFAPRPGLRDEPGNYFNMSYVLTEENGYTKLQIIQEDNRPGAVKEEPRDEANPVLLALKAIAETIG